MTLNHSESVTCSECTDGGGSLAGELHVLQRGLWRLDFVPEREVQVQKRTLSICSPLKCTGKHHSLRDHADRETKEGPV